ncbi:hypothetical protein [Azospirillum sp. Sh1]|uniref:hypothetical protein n=1 Tax=Azospirillum sp. Sh1 TaxID=2607285 RepID=UPI0011ED2B74|nr:hypothetical protein [Azospirillum sp. Sh1]KAA0573450.1 hypothetical protein FZ029_20955 [Azospirillum sp. Sh1]
MFNWIINKVSEITSEFGDALREERLKSIKGFKEIKNGVKCFADESALIAHVPVKWLFEDHFTEHAITRAAVHSRVRSAVIADSNANNPIAKYKSVYGLLYKNIDGVYFLCVQNYKGEENETHDVIKRGSLFATRKWVPHTFYSAEEFRSWCEDHLSVDEYVKIFG